MINYYYFSDYSKSQITHLRFEMPALFLDVGLENMSGYWALERGFVVMGCGCC